MRQKRPIAADKEGISRVNSQCTDGVMGHFTRCVVTEGIPRVNSQRTVRTMGHLMTCVALKAFLG